MEEPGGLSNDDRRFMQATLAFGRRGLGATAPNPSVGALVVKDGIVLGRGVTAPGGRPHAETQALDMAGPQARGATLYVTLEPCSHHGHTRPCADAIVEAGIGRVVAAIVDPDPRVAGRGIERIRRAGIPVVTGACADVAFRDHLGHIRRVREGRPMLTLKLAETQDGFAAGPPGHGRLLITGQPANDAVHAARALNDAILVGIGTALADDPLLTVRLTGVANRPRPRIVLDAHARLPLGSRLVASAKDQPLIVIANETAPPGRADMLRQHGADVVTIAGIGDTVNLESALRALAARGFTRIFCEGGPRLAGALLAKDAVDAFMRLTGSEALGREGLPALDDVARDRVETGRFVLVEDRPIGRDRLRFYERDDTCSPV